MNVGFGQSLSPHRAWLAGGSRGPRVGDIVLSLDGQAINGTDELVRMLGLDSIGKAVTLGVIHAARLDHVELTPVERLSPRR